MVQDQVEKPLACWRGRDRIGGEVLPSLTIILKTTGCAWNRCRMCGYRHERYPAASMDETVRRLLSQLAWVQKEIGMHDIRLVKIYTSGSFFDPAEVPDAVRYRIAECFRGKLVIAESRPEYVRRDVIDEFIAAIDTGDWEMPLYVAMGLETTSDTIREKSIDKGFSFHDFTTAADTAHAAGAGVKTYLLMKPLFLTENEAVEDMLRSVRESGHKSDLVSMNPCTVQKGTEMERFWKQMAYRPPYLWSVLEVLAGADRFVTCDPVGGGRTRGAHNCGTCDHGIISGIQDYNLTADRELIGALLEEGCTCREEWRYILSREQPDCMPLTR